eukprot:1191220-Prorocentrum_minimum.AAC.2
MGYQSLACSSYWYAPPAYRFPDAAVFWSVKGGVTRGERGEEVLPQKEGRELGLMKSGNYDALELLRNAIARSGFGASRLAALLGPQPGARS